MEKNVMSYVKVNNSSAFAKTKIILRLTFGQQMLNINLTGRTIYPRTQKRD
jgi:hypothetical protein